jgi:hypothetical protein
MTIPRRRFPHLAAPERIAADAQYDAASDARQEAIEGPWSVAIHADIFVLADGAKIAKLGGNPGTPQAGTWIPARTGMDRARRPRWN